MGKISEVPMLTADEQEIKLNGIVYSATYRGGRYTSEKGFEIEAHRVISINPSARHFRLRCAKGCESEYSYSKGCSIKQFFGSLEKAKVKALADAEKDSKDLYERVDKYLNTLSEIKKSIADFKKLKPISVKQPKALKGFPLDA